ncbi:MAG TPA: group III truncated hemoglobin [Sphingomicrobium sp.]
MTDPNNSGDRWADIELSEEQLSQLVHRFYARVREDAVLGPVFNGAIHDWPEHLEKLTAFWSSVMLTSGRYKGNPMAAHLKQREAIRPSMFDRWLQLWADTARETLSELGAANVIAKAERIAESLQLGMFLRLDGARPNAA